MAMSISARCGKCTRLPAESYGGQPNLPATGPEPAPVPGTLDWDLWLGPAAPRPFNPLMTNQWRAFLDFSSGGALGAWLGHNFGPAPPPPPLHKASARTNMPPVTIHAYQNMRGTFQKPAGMGENDRLFPPMNNLAERGRP